MASKIGFKEISLFLIKKNNAKNVQIFLCYACDWYGSKLTAPKSIRNKRVAVMKRKETTKNVGELLKNRVWRGVWGLSWHICKHMGYYTTSFDSKHHFARINTTYMHIYTKYLRHYAAACLAAWLLVLAVGSRCEPWAV